MGGIIGIFSFNKKVNEIVIYKMLESMQHRGLDGSSVYISEDKKLCLGSVIFSTIDPTKNVHHIISNEDKNLFMIFDGEIYNFEELKKELLYKGHKFKFDFHFESLLHLYEEERENCVLKLRGIFSFAIWDNKEKKLFIARDRLGVRPVYYYYDNDYFIFSSEAKPIFENFNSIKKNINLKAIEGFLCFGSMPFPFTIFKNLKILEPSSYLILKDKKIEIKKYYYIKENEYFSKNYKELKENLYNIFDESIKTNLMGNIPSGIFLSGGLDSSILVYFARKNKKGNLKTFSIIFKEKEFDEREYSRLVSKKFETEHYEYLVTSLDMKNEIDRFLNFMDMPTIDGFNTYFISKIAKENNIKYSLSGIGGDELFGGYNSFFQIPKMLKFKDLKLILKILSNFLKEDKKDKLNFFILNTSIEGAFFSIRGLFTPLKLKKLLKYKEISFDPIVYLKEIFEKERFLKDNLMNNISLLELRTYMHNQLLRDTDNFSMCNSLEIRVPFLDSKLLEFAFSILPKYKIDKKILKDLMKDYLPQDIIKRKKKAFFFPIEKWIREDLRDFVKEGIFSIDSFFDKKEVEKLWKEFEKGNIHWSRVWTISILNHYLEKNKIL